MWFWIWLTGVIAAMIRTEIDCHKWRKLDVKTHYREYIVAAVLSLVGSWFIFLMMCFIYPNSKRRNL